MPLRQRFSIAVVFASWLLLACAVGNGWAETRVAVVYPTVKEPYFSVFQTILRGIESQLGPGVRVFVLPEESGSDELNGWLQREQLDTVIALGRQGYLAASVFQDRKHVIVGGLPVVPGGVSGVSLAPDPAVLFTHLRELAPGVRRVHVVYSESTAWLIKTAEAAARARGLRLSAYPVNDLREAVHQYRDLLQNIRGTSEAIWVPLDNVTGNDEVILPMLLQAAWEKNLVVFSSRPSHAQRGVLFSLYPDHFALGQRLAQMAASGNSPSAPRGVAPLADMQLAVNLRTAFQIGLRFTPRQQEKFELTFPAP